MSDQWNNVYRLNRSLRTLGLLHVACFVGMAIVSAVAALLNVDGSFKHPVAAAIFFSSAFGFISLIGWWLLLTHYRYRLSLSDTEIRQDGPLRSHAVTLHSIHQAEWRLRPQGGSIAISFTDGQFKIEFSRFAAADRHAIILHLRAFLPGHSQRNWDAFSERFVTPNPERDRQQLRVGHIISLAVLAFAVAFAVAAIAGLGRQYFVCSLLNVAAFVWARRKKRGIP